MCESFTWCCCYFCSWCSWCSCCSCCSCCCAERDTDIADSIGDYDGCDEGDEEKVPFIKPYSPPLPVSIKIVKEEKLYRQPYHSLSGKEKKRFMDALKYMIKPISAPSFYNTPFFTIAAYNRWPMNFSKSVPTDLIHLWYRAYILEFETELGKAGVGKIALPYIDANLGPHVPDEIRNFKFPEEFYLANDQIKTLKENIPSDAEIQKKLRPLFNGNKKSIQETKDIVLNAYGLNQSVLEIASFHPLFYLVMCFLDKLYSKECQLDPMSFNRQNYNHWIIMLPFTKTPSQLIELDELGYKY